MATPVTYDLVVVGGTPAGLMAGIAAARRGHRVVVLERTAHLGGLVANGLGVTDIATRGCAGGLFKEFIARVHRHYLETYGPESPQVRDSSQGYHFEPHVAESILEAMVAEQANLTILRKRQFDAAADNIVLEEGRLREIRITDRTSGQEERYRAAVFVDATYEGDLAAAAGVPFSTRREGHDEYGEPLAGRVYKRWSTPPTELGDGSTGEGDDTIQAYNFRLCLTRADNRVIITRPPGYRRDEYAGLAEDVRLGRWTGSRGEMPFGMRFVTNPIAIPNSKTDANNQHHAFISTDLPEENYPWPTADWAWRDRFAQRLRDYTLGLLWFAQHDESLPEEFRRDCLSWGLAADEFADNGHFPRQVYVREGRRIEGEYRFTAHDSLPTSPGARPPLHADSIAASHYPIDSHAHRKREPNRVHLDGFLSHPNSPYTVPYRIIVPLAVDGLLVPVAVSASHLGFGTLRMEPCWMAMGEAAGAAAALSIETSQAPRKIDVRRLQDILIEAGAVLIYYRDASPDDRRFGALQRAGLRGELPDWEARLDEPLEAAEAARYGLPEGTPRGAALAR